MSIIGISGRIGSGKDTFAQMIIEQQPGWEIKKFAAKLKQITSILTGVPVGQFEDQDFKKLDSDFGMTYRELLQKIGTEAMRDNIHTDVWVRALFSDYKKKTISWDTDGNSTLDAYPNWIITDCRFPNEADAIRDRGGYILRIDRPGTANGTHPSETALDDYLFDWVISNSGDLDDLRYKAKLFLEKLKKSCNKIISLHLHQ